MRLLLVVEEENLGGAELSFLELTRALAARCDVHLAVSQAALHQHSAAYQSVTGGGVTLHAIGNRLNPGAWTNLHPFLRRQPARELARLIETIRPDVVIANLPTVEWGQIVADAAALVTPRLPVWGLLHLVQRPSTIGARLGRLRDPLVGKLLRRFDRLFTVSSAGARELSERYGIRLPDVLYPPTPPLEPVGSATELYQRREQVAFPSGFLLGLVGRIQLRQKGHDTGLRVLSRLLQAGHRLHLMIIGDGPDTPAVRRLAGELGLTSHVRFLGWRLDVGGLISLLDAVLLPSRFEGLPQTALQAATAHVPVIGYSVDGLAEFLPAGFRVPYGDESGLVSAVESLLQGRAAWPTAEMAERAATWGSPDAAAERLLPLLGSSMAPTE
jgi:glycosyltransferase involved in cell wall biosynthesis